MAKSNKELWLEKYPFGYYNTESDKGTGAEVIDSSRPDFDNYDDDSSDFNIDWDDYERSLDIDDSMSDEEDDYHHANLYGGDTTYCVDCGTKKIFGDDGYSYCPDCRARAEEEWGRKTEDFTEDRDEDFLALDEAYLNESRECTIRVRDLIDDGALTAEQVCRACVDYMSEDDAEDIANTLLDDEIETYGSVRQYSNALIDMCEEGSLSWETLLDEYLAYMSEDDVCDMAYSNEFLEDEDEEETVDVDTSELADNFRDFLIENGFREDCVTVNNKWHGWDMVICKDDGNGEITVEFVEDDGEFNIYISDSFLFADDYEDLVDTFMSDVIPYIEYEDESLEEGFPDDDGIDREGTPADEFSEYELTNLEVGTRIDLEGWSGNTFTAYVLGSGYDDASIRFTTDASDRFNSDIRSREVGVSSISRVYDDDLSIIRGQYSSDEDLEEGWSHFEYTSGANPYIAKTEEEKKRICDKYGKDCEFKGNINGNDYYVINDKSVETPFVDEIDEGKELKESILTNDGYVTPSEGAVEQFLDKYGFGDDRYQKDVYTDNASKGKEIIASFVDGINSADYRRISERAKEFFGQCPVEVRLGKEHKDGEDLWATLIFDFGKCSVEAQLNEGWEEAYYYDARQLPVGTRVKITSTGWDGEDFTIEAFVLGGDRDSNSVRITRHEEDRFDADSRYYEEVDVDDITDVYYEESVWNRDEDAYENDYEDEEEDFDDEEEDFDESLNETLEGRYCIVARTNDGKFKFYKDGAFVDDYKEATIFTDMDEARAEWFDIDKSKYKRVFIPNYDESSFATLNENREDDRSGTMELPSHLLDANSKEIEDKILKYGIEFFEGDGFITGVNADTSYGTIEIYFNADVPNGDIDDFIYWADDKLYSETLNENKEDDLYDYKTRQATGDDWDPLLNKEEPRRSNAPMSLKQKASIAYKNNDDDFFYGLSDDELVTLWIGCKIVDENPYGAPYDDEVYSAIYDRPNKDELFDRADREVINRMPLYNLKRVYARYYGDSGEGVDENEMRARVIKAVHDYKLSESVPPHFIDKSKRSAIYGEDDYGYDEYDVRDENPLPHIKMRRGNRHISLNDTSNVGEEGHPIQRGLRGRVNKFESILTEDEEGSAGGTDDANSASDGDFEALLHKLQKMGNYGEFIKALKGLNANQKKLFMQNFGKVDAVKPQVQEGGIAATKLIPTQSEIDWKKSLSYGLKQDCSYFFSPPVELGMPVLTYAGKYIIDGHHRWSQVFMFNPKAEVKCTNFNYDQSGPLDALKDFQAAVLSQTGNVNVGTAGTNIWTVSEGELQKFIDENMTDACWQSLVKAGVAEDREGAIKYIISNAMTLKNKVKPISNAPDRVDMPQTTPEVVARAKKGITDMSEGVTNGKQLNESEIDPALIDVDKVSVEYDSEYGDDTFRRGYAWVYDQKERVIAEIKAIYYTDICQPGGYRITVTTDNEELNRLLSVDNGGRLKVVDRSTDELDMCSDVYRDFKDRLREWQKNHPTTANEGLSESKQLNEGPGAGYTLSGKLKITDVESLTPVKFENGGEFGYTGSYDVTFNCVALGTISDFEFQSYMYGDKIDSAGVEITGVKVNFYAENGINDIESLVKSNLNHIAKCIVGASVSVEHIYGGGWSHSTFDGTVSDFSDNVKDSYTDSFRLINGEFWGDIIYTELFDLEATIKDTDVINYVDKAVTGDNIVNEYAVFDSDDELVDTFFEESDAIEFAKENNYARVDREEFIEKANGDQDFGGREIVWENDSEEEFK